MKWLDYGVLETILLYRLGWDICILAVLGRWLLCSSGCLVLTQVTLYRISWLIMSDTHNYFS